MEFAKMNYKHEHSLTVAMMILIFRIELAASCFSRIGSSSTTSVLTFIPKTASRKDPNLLKNGFQMTCQSSKAPWRELSELSIEAFDPDTSSYTKMAVSALRPFKQGHKLILWENPLYMRKGHTRVTSKYKEEKRMLTIRVGAFDESLFIMYRCKAKGILSDGSVHFDFSPRVYYYLHD